MPPEALSLALLLIEEGIKEEPALAAELRNLFSAGDPTPADWAGLRIRVACKAYHDYVPQSALPVAVPPVVLPVQAPAAAPTPASTPAPQTTSTPVAVFTGQATDPHAS